MVEVISSASGSHWHIVFNGVIIEGAPKRGHGRATKAQMMTPLNTICQCEPLALLITSTIHPCLGSS